MSPHICALSLPEQTNPYVKRENSEPEICPLCGTAETSEFDRDEIRPYLLCGECSLVFVPPEFHLSREKERGRYDLHENSILDEGYTNFLGRLIKPLKARYDPGSKALDFGSGPNPVMARLLSAAGFEVEIYDSFFEPQAEVFDQTFDFITLTEVLEHLSRPHAEIKRLQTVLRPGGSIAVMMRLLDDSIDFSGWHYKNDPTHICFYKWETCLWVAGHFGLKAKRIEEDIVVFEKPTRENTATV